MVYVFQYECIGTDRSVAIVTRRLRVLMAWTVELLLDMSEPMASVNTSTTSYGAVHLDTATFVRVPNRPEAEPKFFDHFRTCLYPQNVVQNTKGSIFCSLKTLGKGFRSTRTFKMHLKRASRDINPNLDAVQFYILASFYPIKKLSCQFVPLMKRSRLARQIVIRLTPASASPVVRK